MSDNETQSVDTVKQSPNSSNNGDIYWQVGNSASVSFLQLYERKLWTDVSFRCKDHETDNPDDKPRAHKVILAARSPVFSAMFFGPAREENDEVNIPEYNKDSVDKFLRCLYTDDMELELHDVIDVFKLAHFYQVSYLADRCGEIMAKGVTEENACELLELSMIYEHRELRDSLLAFIDDNTEAVLKTQSFLSVSRATLEYMLRGDTLHANEMNIVKAAIRWATERLSQSNKDVDGSSIKEILGDAFYFLRMTRMENKDFVKTEKEFRFHDYEECLQIHSCFANGKPQSVQSHFPHERRLRSKHIKFEKRYIYNDYCTSTPTSQFDIKTNDEIVITHLQVHLPLLVYRHNFRVSLKSNLLTYDITLNCQEAQFEEQKTTARGTATSDHEVALDPPLVLHRSETTVYSLKVTVGCSAFLDIEYQDQSFTTCDHGTTSIKCKNGTENKVVNGITLMHRSKRDENTKKEPSSDQSADSGSEWSEIDEL